MDPAWDATIARLPGASFFHGAAWARVLQRTYGFEPYYLVHESDGELRGLLPLMEVDSWLTGRRGVSLPFTDHCAPLGDDAVIGELAREAMRHAQTRHWKHWEVRGANRALGAPASQEFHGHTIDLQATPEKLFARCDGAVRRAVRKAEAGELTLTYARDLAATREFHRLLCQTRRRHGVPPQPFRFFENIQREVLQREQGCIVLAHVAGRAVAGAVFFHFGRSALFKFGASDEQFQHLRSNNLVLWRAIEWHARAGFARLDLGRTALSNEGLRRFKLSWGATEQRLEYARFDCRSAAFVTAPEHTSRWPSRLFRFFPPSLARLVGALAYKHAA